MADVNIFKIFNILLLSFCGILSSILLINCTNKKNDILVGDWSPTTIKIQGTTIKYSDLIVNNQLFDLCFTKDGKCSVTIGGVKNDGIYSLNKSSVEIKINNKSQKLSFEGKTLTMSLDYDNTDTLITFVRTE